MKISMESKIYLILKISALEIFQLCIWYYDKSANTHRFGVGDQVLVLLSTAANRLNLQWQTSLIYNGLGWIKSQRMWVQLIMRLTCQVVDRKGKFVILIWWKSNILWHLIPDSLVGCRSWANGGCRRIQ